MDLGHDLTAPIADTSRTALFYVTEAWQRLSRRLARGRISALRFVGTTPDRLLVAPIDLRAADAHIATEIYAGRFPLAGNQLENGGASPFLISHPSTAFTANLHEFSWLRHMRAADHDLAAANGRSLVDDWIAAYGRNLNSIAYRPDILSVRLVAWFSHSPVVLRGADHGFYRRFLKSIALQMRYLKHIAPGILDDETRFRARIALAMASLCLPTPAGAINAAARRLDAEFERQILPDGGHISRNPQVLLTLLTDLLPLRQTYVNVGHRVPVRLSAGIDRMFAALRFFRHSNGEVALFNGASAVSANALMTILHYDDTAGQPFREAPHSAFQRLSARNSVVIADTGAPPHGQNSRKAHGGCLSFEMSSGNNRFIVNSGGPGNENPDHVLFSRLTAAHSTLTINDTSSLRFSKSRFLGPIIVGGVSKVSVENIDAPGRWLGFSASHNGYLGPVGKIHCRDLQLAEDGSALHGRDRIELPGGKPIGERDKDTATLRFHLDPAIQARQHDDGTIILNAPDGECWAFLCGDARPEIGDDVHFAGLLGLRASKQIVLTFALREISDISWTLMRVPRPPVSIEAENS